MSNQGKAYIFGLITVMFWSTVGSAFKISLRYMDTFQLLFYANLVAIVCFGAILLWQKKFLTVFTYPQKQYLQSLGLGMLNPFLYYLVLFKAFDLLPAQEAQPLNYTWALVLAYLSIPLLKQRIAFKDILAGLVGYSGVLVISTHGNILALRFSNTLGVALALGSTVIWALYWIYNTKNTIDPVSSLFLNFLFGFPAVLAACLIFSRIGGVHPYGLLGAVYVGLFEMGITFVCWAMALKLSENTAKVGNLIFISPFLSLVFIHYLVGEEILPSTFIGLIIIIAGLLIQQYKLR